MDQEKIPYEHFQDVSHLASSFDIMDETVMTRLLSYSFKGNVVEWFRTLTPQSINIWGKLFQDLIKTFAEYIDDSTFLSLISCIKRHPHESIDNFNIIFEKTWKSILTRIRTTNSQALVYYRKNFHPDLNVLIFISKETFLEVYQIEKIAKYMLVSFEKMQLRSIIPLFSNLPPNKYPTLIPHPGVLALSPPSPKPII